MASKPTRRHLLGFAGAAALSPFLAGCGREEPEASAGLTLATTLATQQDEDFLNEWLGRFRKETGAKVTPRLYPDAQYQNALGLLFQERDRPTVFRMVKQTGEMQAAYQKDWIQPLDRFEPITSLLEKEYPPEASDPVLSGLHIGKRLYGMPAYVDRPWGAARPLMCNRELLDQYGIDRAPSTWGELREAAVAVSESSKGEVAGLGLVGGEPSGLDVTVYALQNVAGPQMSDPAGTPINYMTGRPGASDQSFLDAIELLNGLAKADALPRGWESMKPPQLWQQFASGKVAMAIIPSWWWAEVHKINPDLELEFVATPVPDSGRKGYGSIGNIRNPGSFQPYWGISKDARNAKQAAELIAFLSGVDPQREYYEKSGLVTALSAKYTDVLKPEDRRLLELAKETQRSMPNPLSRDERAVDVLAAVAPRSPKPTLNELFLDGIRGKLEYPDAAATFDAELRKVFTEELQAAKVDRETFAFPDWDPMENYA